MSAFSLSLQRNHSRHLAAKQVELRLGERSKPDDIRKPLLFGDTYKERRQSCRLDEDHYDLIQQLVHRNSDALRRIMYC